MTGLTPASWAKRLAEMPLVANSRSKLLPALARNAEPPSSVHL